MKFIAAISTAAAIKHKSSQTTTTGGPPSTLDTCENGPGVDSFGDGCEWYDMYPTDCGWYDTATWSSHEACCACKGMPAPDTMDMDMGPSDSPMYDDWDICEEMLDMFDMMFEWMDADGNGSISVSEAMDFGLTTEDLEEFGGLDMDGDDELSMEELTPLVNEELEYYGCEGI